MFIYSDNVSNDIPRQIGLWYLDRNITLGLKEVDFAFKICRMSLIWRLQDKITLSLVKHGLRQARIYIIILYTALWVILTWSDILLILLGIARIFQTFQIFEVCLSVLYSISEWFSALSIFLFTEGLCFILWLSKWRILLSLFCWWLVLILKGVFLYFYFHEDLLVKFIDILLKDAIVNDDVRVVCI